MIPRNLLHLLASAAMATLSVACAPTEAASAEPAVVAVLESKETPVLDHDQKRIFELETRYFGHGYHSENNDKRLSRLENLVFGMPTPGATPERLKKIEAIAADIDKQKKAAELKTLPVLNPAPVKQAKGKKLTFNQQYAVAAQDIRLKRYHAAADGLLKVINMNPRYSPAYAYLGDVLLKLKDYEGAKEAYRAGFEVDPFGQYGRYGKARLMGLAQRDAYMRTQPQDTPIVVERTIKLINRQSNDLSSRYVNEGQTWSRWRTALANIQLRRIAQDSHTSMTMLRRRNYTLYNDHDEMSDINMLRTSYLRNDAVVQGMRARVEATRKAAHVAQSAANLKALMMQPSRPGDAKLRALGTNLYVRYYGSDTPSWSEAPVPEDPAIELAAKAHKLRKI
jgi:tetratricopeptide (TPR) repeat protein